MRRERADTYEEASTARRYARNIGYDLDNLLERCEEATTKANPKSYISPIEEYFNAISHKCKEAKAEIKKLASKQKRKVMV